MPPGAGAHLSSGHFLGDLGIACEVVSDTSAVARTRAGPFVTGADGGARVGVLATLVDVVGGLLGVQMLRPDRMATADLTLQLARPVLGPVVEARARLARRGRTTMVIEALLVELDDSGTEVPAPGGRVGPCAWSSLTVAVLPAGNGDAGASRPPVDLPPRVAIKGPDLDRPIADAMGMVVEDASSGRVSLPVHPRLHNSLGAVQGGAMALLGDVAATEALGATGGWVGAASKAMVVTDLTVTYLALGRAGPIVTRTTVLDSDPAGHRAPTSASAVVELVDAGAGNRLTTVVNARATAVDAFSRAPGNGTPPATTLR